MNDVVQHVVREDLASETGRKERGLLMSLIKSPRGIQMLVVVSDLIALSLVFPLFYLIRVISGIFSGSPTGFPLDLVLLTTTLQLIFWMFLFWFAGVYISIHNRSLFDEYYSVLKVIGLGFLLVVVALLLSDPATDSDAQSNRVFSLLIYFFLLSGCVALSRYFVRGIVRKLRRRGIGLRRTLIVGESARSRQLLEMLSDDLALGYRVVGTVSTGSSPSPEFARFSLGSLDEIDMIIARRRIEVTVLGMDEGRDVVPRLITDTAIADTTIKIVPDLYDMVSGQARAQHIYGVPLIEINPQIMPPWQQHAKRIFDVLFSVGILLFGMPVWLFVALVVKLEDGGPVLFSQPRLGLGSRQFTIYKYRSMRVDADKISVGWTVVNDPRVTRIGRIIRKLHIDEIPQFWNVLTGDMSIVGPRPEQPKYVEKFSKMLPAYPRRLRVKPGVTGWNQVHMEEVVETVDFLQERLRHDFFYIENMSLRLDLEIIFRTIIRVLQRKGQA